MKNINWLALIGGILMLVGGVLYLSSGGAVVWGVVLTATAAMLLVTSFVAPRRKKTAAKIR